MGEKSTEAVAENIELFIEDQDFLPSYDLTPPSPPPPSPTSKLDWRHTGEGEGSGGGDISYDDEKARSSINHSILYEHALVSLAALL
jgi:hypothetical protein